MNLVGSAILKSSQLRYCQKVPDRVYHSYRILLLNVDKSSTRSEHPTILDRLPQSVKLWYLWYQWSRKEPSLFISWINITLKKRKLIAYMTWIHLAIPSGPALLRSLTLSLCLLYLFLVELKGRGRIALYNRTLSKENIVWKNDLVHWHLAAIG